MSVIIIVAPGHYRLLYRWYLKHVEDNVELKRREMLSKENWRYCKAGLKPMNYAL